MSTNIKDIINNTKEIYLSESSLETLMDFERVLDEIDLYAYANWQKGELVEGPLIEKYFVTCTFMWPYSKMPDPKGGKRLLHYGCEVKYVKSKLKVPTKIESENDFKPGTKYPKMRYLPIWLVTIVIPKSMISEIEKGNVDVEGDTLDLEDLSLAYEAGVDEDSARIDTEDDTSLATQDEGLEDKFNEDY